MSTPIQTIYFDADAHDDDGAGWTIYGGIGLRFPTMQQCIAWCESNNLPWSAENGVCDCGFIYDASSRFDHDADTGECWSCSDRNINEMTSVELDDYLSGGEVESISIRQVADALYEALKTCRPWIDDFQQGDEALALYIAVCGEVQP